MNPTEELHLARTARPPRPMYPACGLWWCSMRSLRLHCAQRTLAKASRPLLDPVRAESHPPPGPARHLLSSVLSPSVRCPMGSYDHLWWRAFAPARSRCLPTDFSHSRCDAGLAHRALRADTDPPPRTSPCDCSARSDRRLLAVGCGSGPRGTQGAGACAEALRACSSPAPTAGDTSDVLYRRRAGKNMGNKIFRVIFCDPTPLKPSKPNREPDGDARPV